MRKTTLLNKLSIVVSVLFLFGCSENNENLEILGNDEIPLDAVDNGILLEKERNALYIAAFGTELTESDVLKIANGEWSDNLRSAQLSSVKKVHLFAGDASSVTTRSAGNVDSIPLYIVYNKSADKSLLISGDRRVPEILAEVNGDMTLEETESGFDIWHLYTNRHLLIFWYLFY